MSFTISPNGPPAKDTSSIRHRRCETRGERRRPARAHPDLPRPPSLQPRRAPPSSLRERRPGPKHWSHDRRVSGTRRWLPRTCAGLGTQFASVCSAAGVRRVRSEIVSDLGHAHEGVRPRKQHGDHLLRTLPIDRQTLSFQVGSDPHLYVSRAVRCFVMRAGDRAVRLAALHGERGTWIQPVDSVDRRSDSSEVAGVTRQPYASTDRRKMLDERGVSCLERPREATSRRRSGDDCSRGIGAHDLRTRIHLLNLGERGLPKARIVRYDVLRSPEDDRAVRIEALFPRPDPPVHHEQRTVAGGDAALAVRQ